MCHLLVVNPTIRVPPAMMQVFYNSTRNTRLIKLCSNSFLPLMYFEDKAKKAIFNTKLMQRTINILPLLAVKMAFMPHG